jgi:hypothetical protein
MSYLQALNAGLLETADTNPTLDTVLSDGNTSSSSINLTGTGSLNLTGTGDIDITSGNVIIENGSLEFGPNGDYGTIVGNDGQGMVITAANGILFNSVSSFGYSPCRYIYTTTGIPTLNTQCGYTQSYSAAISVPLTAYSGDAVWTQLYQSTVAIDAGVYLLNAVIYLDSTNTLNAINRLLFSIANVGTTTPAAALISACPVNSGVWSFTVPFVSTGISTANNVVQFVYSTNITDITVSYIAFGLTRIG